MNNYGNPMVTYNEIIEALKAILDCSKTNGYLDEYNFLNVKYDVLNKSPLYEEQEQALIQAIQSLEKTIDAADKVIRENLKDILNEILTSNSFIVPTRYKKDEEYRKLAAQDEFVSKLKEMSLPLEVLSEVPNVPVVEKVDSLDEIENLVTPFEEVEIASLDLPTLEEEPIEDIYYSRTKLGNVKTAFAVTEEQYQKLKKSSIEEKELEDLPELVVGVTENVENKILEQEQEEEKVEDLNLSDISTEAFTLDEAPKENSVSVEVTDDEKKDSEVVSEKEEEKVENTKEESTEIEDGLSSEQKKASLDRIKLIKKALDKAKEKENSQLVQILEQQLRKELEALKS